jgi:hypothetical protein
MLTGYKFIRARDKLHITKNDIESFFSITGKENNKAKIRLKIIPPPTTAHSLI